MMPALIRAGYHEYFSIGLLTSAGSVGILIPPSIPMIIYAMVMGISVTKQFLAGFIPGFLVAGAFILFSFILSARNGWRSDTPANWVEIKKALKEGIWGLSLPFIVLGGIYSGVFTPTEASAVAVVSALVIELFIYRSISFKQLPKIFKESTILASALLFIISAAGAMSWYVGLEQIPAIVAEWIGETIQQRWLFLLLVNVFLLCLGCVMDLVSGLLILGPIFLPLLDKFQIDPLHFGIIMMINMELGFCTPPYGLNLFVSSGVMKAPLSVVARGTIPFILLMFLVLQFITYVPSICSFLPALLE
jgi:C4-dicarboxylate transporter DctM subunit